jgi:hypothetical protein
MLKELLEASCDVAKEVKKLKGDEVQLFRIKVLDRIRTNFDSRWQAEYFYGDYKEKSEEDAKFVQNVYAKYGFRCPEEEFAKYFVGGDLKKYFKNIK